MMRFLFLVTVLLLPQKIYAATWEAQAERLQLVSAALLDAAPLLSPIQHDALRVEAKSVISFLPKLNTTVGNKTERTPQPPVHALPTFELGGKKNFESLGLIGGRVWGGYLPGGSSKLMGMTAACVQQAAAFSLNLEPQFIDDGTFIFETGMQLSRAIVKGGITEPEADDEFNVVSRLNFASLTLSHKSVSPLWVQAQVIERHVGSTFHIPSDGTTFQLEDKSLLSNSRAASQLALGYDVGWGFQGAIAYLKIPQRVSMPRVLVSYHMVLR